MSLVQQIFHFIDRRYRLHSRHDLQDVLWRNGLFHRADADVLTFSSRHRRELAATLDRSSLQIDLAGYCVEQTIQFTQQRNQFIQLTDYEKNRLERNYQQFLIDLQNLLRVDGTDSQLRAGYETVLRQHHHRLRAGLLHTCRKMNEHAPANLLLKTVPCEEYSPELQLDILGLEPETLLEPVLDLGCGEHGHLVEYLLEMGIEAVGADRWAPQRPEFFRNDWFDLDLSGYRWGTVIAHQSLSTHFLYHHSLQTPFAEHLARLFMDVLNALIPGGRFCYSPGLDFFEPLLQSRSDLKMQTIPITPLAGMPDNAHSTRIQKL